MKLIGPLCSGIRGAENGHAELYKRGTSTRATWYVDFEATASNSSGANITLDSNGGAIVFVDEYVTVTVKDSGGNVVRTFTAGEAATDVEVRSDSFTGTDYATLASATSNPVQLSAILNLWNDSAGGADWLTLFNGSSAAKIKDVISILAGGALPAASPIFHNVRSTSYNAAGDGIADDGTAIQSAINAADTAGGGIVLFPEGTYRTTVRIDVPATVHLVGMGAAPKVVLTIDHPTNNLLSFTAEATAPQYLVSMTLKAAQGHTTELLIGDQDTRVTALDCVFGDASDQTGDLTRPNRLSAVNCTFLMGGNGRAYVETNAGDIRFHDCRIVAPAGSYNPTNGMIVSREARITGCNFVMTAMTSGTAYGMYFASGASPIAFATHNRITAPTGGTVKMFNLGAVTQTHNIFEDYNNADGAISATFGLYQITSFTSVAASVWEFYLGSRERKSINISDNSASLDLNAQEYALIINERTAAAAQGITANAIIPNGTLTLIIKNSEGAAGSNHTTDAADFRPSETYSIATSGNYDVRSWRGADVDGVLLWWGVALRNNI